MNVEISITNSDVERIVQGLVAALQAEQHTRPRAWLDVDGAAGYLATTAEAIRALVKRQQIPCHRLETGRIRFDSAELDDWVRSAQ